eukprot:153943-Rhodomonas_salina.1
MPPPSPSPSPCSLKPRPARAPSPRPRTGETSRGGGHARRAAAGSGAVDACALQQGDAPQSARAADAARPAPTLPPPVHFARKDREPRARVEGPRRRPGVPVAAASVHGAGAREVARRSGADALEKGQGDADPSSSRESALGAAQLLALPGQSPHHPAGRQASRRAARASEGTTAAEVMKSIVNVIPTSCSTA